MSIKSLAKAASLARGLKDVLEKKIAGSAAGRVDTVREAKDSDGYPALFLSDNANEAAGQPVLALLIRQIDAGSKDVFGNDLKAYAPHVCILAYELDTGGKQIPSQLDVVLLMNELAKLGIKLQVKEIANGTAVTIANIDAAAVVEEHDWLLWPTKGV